MISHKMSEPVSSLIGCLLEFFEDSNHINTIQSEMDVCIIRLQ